MIEKRRYRAMQEKKEAAKPPIVQYVISKAELQQADEAMAKGLKCEVPLLAGSNVVLRVEGANNARERTASSISTSGTPATSSSVW